MRYLFESYTDYLSSNPGEFTSLIFWFITMAAAYTILIRFRKSMIEGSKGENNKWEPAEQVLYLVNWVWPGVVAHAWFFYQAEWVKYFMFGIIAWALGGKWLFEWGLAFFRGGKAPAQDAPAITTITDKHIETIDKSIETKIEPKK